MYNGASTDNISRTLNFGNSSNLSRTGIYSSQRNQYFANKKHKQDLKSKLNNAGAEEEEDEIKTNPMTNPSREFIGTGLDNNPNSYYYNKNQGSKSNDTTISEEEQNNSMEAADNKELTHSNKPNKSIESSIQYHTYDAANSLSKSSIKSYKNGKHVHVDEDEDDEDTTTTDELTDDTAVTKQHMNRFNKLKDQSLANLSTNTTDTYAAHFAEPRQKPMAKINNISPPNKQSTPNLVHHQLQSNNYFGQINKTSYDKFMNTTTDDDEQQDNNSSRLLTHKVNSSSVPSKPMFYLPPKQKFFTPIVTANSSLVSKSNTNLTNISSLPSNNPSQSDLAGELASIQSKLPDYEIYQPMATPLTLTKRNVYTINSSCLPAPPPIPRSGIPTGRAAPRPFLPMQQVNNYSDDNESVMSCQVIASSSLLLNRDYVREAKHIIVDATTHSSQTQTPHDVLFKDSSDSNKPPPMETCI